MTLSSIWPSASLISSLLVALSCGGGAPSAHAPGDDAPTLVFLGGDVLTMDPARARVSAVAVRGDRIIAIGTDDEVAPLIAPSTQVIRLDGRSMTPGLVDGHAHLYGLGSALESVSVRDVASADEAAARVAAAARERPAGEWITGRGWDQNRWSPQAFPHHRVLDAAVSDRPVALRRVDGHALWANGAAIRLAAIDAATPEPAGGQILRDDQGLPTGVFIDSAMDLIERHIPAPSAAVRERRIRAAAQVAVAAGLTGVHEMGIDDDTVAVYLALRDAGALPLRVYAFLEGSPDNINSLPTRTPLIDDGDDYFALRGVKIYADEALGSRGAALIEPYSDEPEHTGNWVTAPRDIVRAVDLAASSGWQTGIHAIGDAAVHEVLNAYERAQRHEPRADFRFRIEHAQVVSGPDLDRFGRLGVLAAMQPTHATSDMPWAEARLGANRILGAYAWRTILGTGGRIVGGSDFPVEEVAPLLGLYAAVTRQNPAGEPEGGWYPDHRLSLHEAVSIFTVEPAFAAFVDRHRGIVQTGYVADFTVFDRRISGDRTLLDTHIDLTVVGGRVVFERAGRTLAGGAQ